MAERTVRLVGGPLDGETLEGYRGGAVLMHSDEEAGKVARYRPTRDKDVLRFRGWDRVVASIPLASRALTPERTKMATVDLRTLPLSEQHHPLAFNSLGRTGRRATDFLWICPECDDGVTHAPMVWTGGTGYFHVAPGGEPYEYDGAMHKLIAVDVIAVIEQYRQLACSDERYAHMRQLGAPKEVAGV